MKIIGDFKDSGPIPHVVIDDVFSSKVFEQIKNAELPPLSEQCWDHYNNPLEKKYALNSALRIPPTLHWIMWIFTQSWGLQFVKEVTGMDDLVCDPKLTGAGVHRIARGGKLDLHLDHQTNPNMPGYERKVNLIYWIHPKWEEEWKGHLELWDGDGKPEEMVGEIMPKPNRMAIFECSNHSFHGHPDALECPPEEYRTSIALYYFRKTDAPLTRKKVKFVHRPGDVDNVGLQHLRDLRADPTSSNSVWRHTGL